MTQWLISTVLYGNIKQNDLHWLENSKNLCSKCYIDWFPRFCVEKTNKMTYIEIETTKILWLKCCNNCFSLFAPDQLKRPILRLKRSKVFDWKFAFTDFYCLRWDNRPKWPTLMLKRPVICGQNVALTDFNTVCFWKIHQNDLYLGWKDQKPLVEMFPWPSLLVLEQFKDHFQIDL